MRFLFILLIISSCGFEFENDIIIQDELIKHYDSFLYEAEIRNYNLPDRAIMIYVTSDIKDSYRAICYSTKKTAIIKIKESYYQKALDWQIEATIFHELGHGLLNRDHLDSGFSLMKVPSERRDYLEKRSDYLDELFYYEN